MKHDNPDAVCAWQDKLRVKSKVQEHSIAVADVLYATESPDSIPFQYLPPDCIIKPNHASGLVILKKHGRYFRFGTDQFVLGPGGELLPEPQIAPLELSEREVLNECHRWLTFKYSVNEPSYHLIQPSIVIEELLRSAGSADLKDYRFYTFTGKVRAISMGSPTFRRLKQNVFFTPDWTTIPLTVYSEQLPSPIPEKPDNLAEMITCAERLGAGIGFVRVDLYDTDRGIVFGEMTFYPHAGYDNTPTACARFNRWIGKNWPLVPFGQEQLAANGQP